MAVADGSSNFTGLGQPQQLQLQIQQLGQQQYPQQASPRGGGMVVGGIYSPRYIESHSLNLYTWQTKTFSIFEKKVFLWNS